MASVGDPAALIQPILLVVTFRQVSTGDHTRTLPSLATRPLQSTSVAILGRFGMSEGNAVVTSTGAFFLPGRDSIIWKRSWESVNRF